MKTRMSPMWAVVEMNSNAVGLTDVVRRSRTAVSAAGRMGHSSRRHELIRHEQAHVLVQHRPAHFERRHEVVIHEERVGRHGRVEFSWRRCALRCRGRPARGPASETQVADARGGIGRFLGRERPRLHGGSREQRIREERKLTTAREVRGLVVVQHELNQPPQERESRGSRVLVCGFEQRPRPTRHHASLGEQFDDRVDRCGDVVVAARGDVWRTFRSTCRCVFWCGVRFVFDRAKVGPGDGVGRDCRRGTWRVLRLPRHLEEGARVGRCRVTEPRTPSLPFDRDVLEVLLRCHQQIVEAVDLRSGVGQAAASLHHRVKVVVVLGIEREEKRDDRTPRIGSLRPH